MAQQKGTDPGDLVNVVPFRKKIWEKDPKDTFLVRHVPTGMWYVRARRKGKRDLFKKTGFTSKTKARTKALLLISEWAGRKHKDFGVILFREFATNYLEYLESSDLRPRTKENARLYIGELIKEMGHENIENINEGFFDLWLAGFRKRRSRTTYLDYAKYLSKVLRHAHRQGLLARLPSIQNPDKPKATGRIYTRDEVDALLAVADLRLETQIRLSLQAFMRLREVLLLEWSRVDLKTGLVRLRAEDVKTGSKTGKGRSFYLPEQALEVLRAWQKTSPASPWVFPNPKRTGPQWDNKTAWQNAKENADIRGKARWHDLRHTALTWALTEGKQNPLLVSEYAGVSLRTIQKVYLKVEPEHTREVSQSITL